MATNGLTSLSKMDREFVKVLKEFLDRGETPPGTRATFKIMIERGVSKRDPRSIDVYGPGKQYSRLRNLVIAEHADTPQGQRLVVG